jgi:hypothetical protein
VNGAKERLKTLHKNKKSNLLKTEIERLKNVKPGYWNLKEKNRNTKTKKKVCRFNYCPRRNCKKKDENNRRRRE